MKTSLRTLLPFLALFFSCHAFSVENEMIKKGERLLNQGLYLDCIDIMQNHYQEHPDDSAVRSLLATAYFLNDNFTEAIALLKSANLTTDQHLLLGLAYSNNKQPQLAIPHLVLFLSDSPNSEMGKFELGRAYFQSGDWESSKQTFAQIKESSAAHWPHAQFYLARIALIAKEDHLAEKILAALTPKIKSTDLAYYELSYLKGQACFHAEDYVKAAAHFEKAIPEKNAEQAPWYEDCLYHLAWSYFNSSTDTRLHVSSRREYLEKAEPVFLRLATLTNSERAKLSLGHYYLIRATKWREDDAFTKAESVLGNVHDFSSEGQTQALLLRAQSAPSYEKREHLFQQLAATNPKDSLVSEGWLLQALNDFEQGKLLLASESKSEEASATLAKAAIAFRKAFEMLRESYPQKAATALIYQAKTFELQNKRSEALAVLEELSDRHAPLVRYLENPDEPLFLQALLEIKMGEKQWGKGEEILTRLIAEYPQGKFADESLYLLGTIYYRRGNFEEAYRFFIRLYEQFPNSPLSGDAVAYAANCADFLKHDLEKTQALRKLCYERYPDCWLASEAYFHYYPYADYFKGSRGALKHLQAFPKRFPEDPLVLNVYYLLGLEETHDRKNGEGKSTRKKNLTAAIDAFQEVENQFDHLMQKGLLPQDNLPNLIGLRYRATLERAQANLAIAEESIGAKRDIYLEYAEEVLRNMQEQFNDPEHPLTRYLGPFSPLQEESAFWLGLTALKKDNQKEAKEVFSQMLVRYKDAKITRGFYLSRTWYELALIAMNEHEFELALNYLHEAEDSAKGKLLNSDQRLDIWIQQSLCYQGLNQLDQAILLLSKAVNDDAISGLRLKALFLRAEVYEKQGRGELARKQLEATAKKGGEWARKAQEKLDKHYGYQ